jgi:tRNA (cytidine/uridine-2'-O-)-methyltransferase
MKVVLFEPQIPQNTGNISRTCFLTSTGLVLVKPLGFSISARAVKRAGIDYWNQLEVEVIDDLEKYLETKSDFFFFSSKSEKLYVDAPYTADSLLIFGSETAGLSNLFWEKWPDKFYKIPMNNKGRCLNLSVSAGVVVYEALKAQNFQPLTCSC